MRLAYDVLGSGDGPALVLLHSIATSRDLWRPQHGALGSRFRLLCIDLPGHGESDCLPGSPALADYADAIASTMDDAGVARAHMAGLSLGGMIAQAFALSYPDRLYSLILANTTARTVPAVFDLWEGRLADLQSGGMEGQVAPTIERWFTEPFRRRAPLTMDWIAGLVRSTDPRGYTAAIRAIQRLDHLDLLPNIEIPTLVIAGAEDKAAPPAAAQLIADAIPDARSATIPDAAHISSVEQPVLFAETIGGFAGANGQERPRR